jgi:hypothetical protein
VGGIGVVVSVTIFGIGDAIMLVGRVCTRGVGTAPQAGMISNSISINKVMKTLFLSIVSFPD